jgi:NAD(P)-dependent dehydrogenase (short-subunit alcohol dehydrogenase family)
LLANQGHAIIMACRNVQKAIPICRQIIAQTDNAEIEVWQLDISSLKSVQNFAQKAQNENITIAALINNAATMNPTCTLTAEGLECTMATNYIGVFWLTQLLLPQMAEEGSILNTVSLMSRFVKPNKQILDFPPRKYSRMRQYSFSKMALLYFTAELHKQLINKNIRVNAIDPGVVNTSMLSMQKWFDPLANILFRPFTKEPKNAAQITLRALASSQNGCVFSGKSKCKQIDNQILNADYGKWLYNETDKLILKIIKSQNNG